MAAASSVHVSHHPLLLHRLGPLRDRATPAPVFRRLVREILKQWHVPNLRFLGIIAAP